MTNYRVKIPAPAAGITFTTVLVFAVTKTHMVVTIAPKAKIPKITAYMVQQVAFPEPCPPDDPPTSASTNGTSIFASISKLP